MTRLTLGGACLLLGVVFTFSGCTSFSVPGIPSGADLRDAARHAGLHRDVWIPALSAAAVGLSGQDADLARRTARDSQLFSDAQGSSDDLKDVAAILYGVTLLAAPADPVVSRSQYLLLDAQALSLSLGASTLLKDVTGRERPDGSNEQSFPSGHASYVATMTALSRAHVARTRLAPGMKGFLNGGFYALSAASAYARVEAGKHHLSDVLAGVALGNFAAHFVRRLAFRDSEQVSLRVLDDGLQLTIAKRF